MNLTIAQFVDMAKDMDSHTFTGVETAKEEKTLKKSRKTGEPVADVITSETRYNPAIGLTYSKTVNNRLKKEGKDSDFKAQELPWGQWVGSGGTIIENKGKHYLRLSLVGANSTKKKYFKNGKEVKFSEIQDIMPAKKKNTNSHQGLKNPIIVVNVKIDTISKIAMNGKVYTIEGAGKLIV